MANTKISALSAVAPAALANEFAVNEAGTSKKASLQQIHDSLGLLAAGTPALADKIVIAQSNIAKAATVQTTLDAVDLLANAGSLADADKLLVIQSSVAKDVALSVVKSYMGGPTIISGASGTANQGGAGSITYQLLTADNAVTTAEAIMTTSSLVAGTYLFEYFVVWRSGTTTVGATFAVDYAGTVTRARSTRWFGSTGTTAATGVSDGVSTVLTGTMVEHHSAVTDGGALGPNTGVGSTSEDQFCTIMGIMVVSTSSDLALNMTGEGNGAVTAKADTMLRLTRLA